MAPDSVTASPAPKSWWLRSLEAVAIGFALVFAYVLVLVGVFTGLNIVSPALAEEPQVTFFLAVVCAVIVVGPPVLLPALLERLRTFPNESLTTPHTDSSVAPIIRNLRIRSRLFKLGAAAAFVMVVAATLLGFTVAQGYMAGRSGTGTEMQGQSTEATGTGSEVQGQSPETTQTGTAVTALVLLLFLLRTLASIYRQNMRLAAFYDSRADYLQAGGKTKDLDHADLLDVFSTTQLDLGWSERLTRAFGRGNSKPAG